VSTLPFPSDVDTSGQRSSNASNASNAAGSAGDFTTTLPSGLIADIVEAYFNTAMFKRRVKVIDLHLQGDMCLFSLAWVPKAKEPGLQVLPVLPITSERDHQGRFTSKTKGKES